MARISVVVPIYNVEGYLEACLDSIARQTVGDFEVVMVDDGSTDSSGAIAERYADADQRFRVVRQPNGGLSKARNTGIDHAAGEFLWFVDSDDVLPADAFELLLGALDETGSDFATGNVHRLVAGETEQARFLARTFSETRLKTHITKHRALLADRTAWNKLWRRSFWDRHGLRFPEGRVNEDIPVVLPLHFSAKSVDVIAEPVYFWRVRESGGRSITERRLERKALLDRVQACQDVHDYLAAHGPRRAKRWYDETLVSDDLIYYLNLLDRAEPWYQELFLEKVNALLDGASPRVFAGLPAIDRLKWRLVRERRIPELVEVLRFSKDEMRNRAPIRLGRRWYGDYPFLSSATLKVKRAVYRLDRELRMTARIEGLDRDGDLVRITGHAFIDGVGAASQGAQRLSVRAVRPGALQRVRHAVTRVRLDVEQVRRPELNAKAREHNADVQWAGFVATLDMRRLGARPGTRLLAVTVGVGPLRRRRTRFAVDELMPPRAVYAKGPGPFDYRVAFNEERELELEVSDHHAALTGCELEGDAVVVSGDLVPPATGAAKLELRGVERARSFNVDASAEGASFSARVPVARLAKAVRPPAPHDPDEADAVPSWTLQLAFEDGRRERVTLTDDGREAALRHRTDEVAVTRTLSGDAALALRAPRAVARSARWTAAGDLEVGGEGAAAGSEIILLAHAELEQHPFVTAVDPDGRFRATLTPARIRSLAGELPLRTGEWELCTRPAGDPAEETLVPVTIAPALRAELPLTTVVDHKGFTLAIAADGAGVLAVRQNLDDHERGRYNSRRSRTAAFERLGGAPLRDTVLYSSFRGRQYSDSPRMIHEELVRRGAPVEHLWIVRDGQANVPETARVVRDGSPEYYEALASTRWFVSNDHFPDWWVRRDDQICVQTWHGTPLKRLGFDVSELRGATRKFERNWAERVANWQYVVSPNRFATPILRSAYRLNGHSEMLETGYPRSDRLAGADRDSLSRALRERLGIPEDVRVALYAPTFRDQFKDRRGRFRLDQQLDVARLRAALGDDWLVLYRKHHYVVDAVPTVDGFVRDVSSYPDGTELLLAADVLISDYSSMMVDFANTRRPMLFFTYDLDSYRDEIRGFYIDYPATVPGPLLRTTDEIAEALRDIDAVNAAHADRYDAFVERFCELDDGHASARVVDHIFSGVAAVPA